LAICWEVTPIFSASCSSVYPARCLIWRSWNPISLLRKNLLTNHTTFPRRRYIRVGEHKMDFRLKSTKPQIDSFWLVWYWSGGKTNAVVRHDVSLPLADMHKNLCLPKELVCWKINILLGWLTYDPYQGAFSFIRNLPLCVCFC
jgi:hypothetical protein